MSMVLSVERPGFADAESLVFGRLEGEERLYDSLPDLLVFMKGLAAGNSRE